MGDLAKAVARLEEEVEEGHELRKIVEHLDMAIAERPLRALGAGRVRGRLTDVSGVMLTPRPVVVDAPLRIC
ncbi:hypothetical protein [Saccharothrix algeriensis]|nr:hypothetical protein [Saccharothrix algeriensis]MBM7813797.1 hypothetical protein [Saccharothrix algeriensis]